jgi:zinc/manganese transport system substrate-binding protein
MRALLAVLLSGSLSLAAPAQARLRVITTLPDFAALAQELGGERVEAESLIRGSQDPHFVDAKPSFILKLSRADLMVCIGLGLEDGWLPVLITQARNGDIQPGGRGHLDASQFVRVLEVPIQADRAMGDVHGGGNPHYYTSPEELYRVARAIHQKLLELDPDGRAEFQTLWQAFEQRYQQKTADWKARLAPLQGMPVVEYHKSWIYFLSWAGFRSAGALEPKPGVPPSAGHVTRLLREVQGQDVRQVWQESYHPTGLSRVFAGKSGARLLVLPSMVGASEGLDTIWAKFDRMIELIAQPR